MNTNLEGTRKKTTLVQLIKNSIENKNFFLIGVLANCISTIFSVALTSHFSVLIDSFGSGGASDGFKDSIVIVVALFVLQIIFGVVSVYGLNYVGLKVVTKIREQILHTVTFAPMSFFDKNSKGEISSRIINDSSILMNLITTSLSESIGALISITFALMLLFRINVKLTLLLLGVFVIFVLFLLPLTQRLAKVSKSIQDNTASLSAYIVQTIANIKLIKSTSQEEYAIDEGDSILNRIFSDSIDQVKFMAVLSPVVNVVLLGSVFLVIAIGGILVASNEITVGGLSSFLMLVVLQIISPSLSLVSFLTSFQSTKGALERIIDLLELRVEDVNSGELLLEQTIDTIEFKKVVFQYASSQKEILNGISFTAKKNDYIALIGPSGSGKSTLYSILEKFYDIQSGEILINGNDISKLSLRSLRRCIGYVTQDSFIVTGSVKDNLLYGVQNKNVSDEDLMAVCKMADIDVFVNSLENGLYTKLEENGMNISGGQKQRISIARTLLAENSLILLDEATSSLDSISEKKVQKTIESLSSNRIVFVIAHRLSTITNASKIIFLDNGNITGIGSHEELLKNHEKYNMFYKQQFQEGNSAYVD